ncbi:hypothetical protein TanjilG_08911 [Lupinus angustifolius]|uniref:Pentacotripeptide-repeat region of PRORP domain-containing protein n=2 Tax=Lupinus angustifolius TaxID=3871 RepID=A0A4P1RVP8_LUPAN|nr:hypothetical protein TanjilG_08911 [Lupinus angustifolius]
MFYHGIPPISIETLIHRSTTLSHLLQLHSLLLKSSLYHHPSLINHLLISATSISLPFSTSFFHSLPTIPPPPLFAFNTLIRAFSNTPSPQESLILFKKLQSSNLYPDHYTFPFVLRACGLCSFVGVGGVLHSLVLKMSFGSDRYVGNTLLKMYADCGFVRFARNMFDEIPVRDVVSWSSLIAGYVACDLPVGALNVFCEMRLLNEKPNSVTLVSLLSACTKMVNISAGESVHSYIVMNCIEMDVGLGTALFEMYSKCGKIDKALRIFNSMPRKNLQSYTIMISALANNGCREDVISLFNQMEDIGLRPDSLSFSAILSACSHMGLVYEGRNYFDRMVRLYGIKPTVEHYGCMVDLLGRAGLIEEAYDVIKNMPTEPNSVILRSFLGACRNHGWVPSLDDKLLSKLESELGANYVLAANIFSARASWKDANDLRLAMKHKGLKKVPGCSWVEVQN